MARLIDAEFIEKWINREEHNTPDERWRPESEFAAMVDNAPTVDAVKVVHGEWEVCEDDWNYETIYECSICGFGIKTEQGVELDWNYCPRCSAKMDGGDE